MPPSLTLSYGSKVCYLNVSEASQHGFSYLQKDIFFNKRVPYAKLKGVAPTAPYPPSRVHSKTAF